MTDKHKFIRGEYDFNDEIYYVNNSMLYLFFILSSYLSTKDKIRTTMDEPLEKFNRKRRREHNSSIRELLRKKEKKIKLDDE